MNGNNGLSNVNWNILATISVINFYFDLISRLKKPLLGYYPKYVLKGHPFAAIVKAAREIGRCAVGRD